jgi:DNA-directed RNA polymerase specialized sigma24 family protein
MWPDDFSEWERRSRPRVLAITRRVLDQLFDHAAPQLQAAATDLAEHAAHEALNKAFARRLYGEYYEDEVQLLRWLVRVAARELLRGFLQHGSVRRVLNLLPAEQRRILGMLHLDGLNVRDIAGVLGITAEEVSRGGQQGLDALRQML